MLLLEYNPAKKKLTRRQRAYRKNRILGMNQYNAARSAGYSHTYSRQACRIDKLAEVSMADLMQQAGLTDEFMIAYAKLGLEAHKLTAFGRSVDWGSRHKFFETLMKMSGKLKVDVAINNDIKILPNIQVTFVSEKVGEKGVATSLEDEDLCAREGSGSNRITEQI